MRRNIFCRLPILLLVACSLYASASFAVEIPGDLRGTEIRQDTVKWEWERVEGASRYEVFFNGIDYGSTRDNMFFTYYMYYPGEFNLRVRAYNGSTGQFSDWTPLARIRTSERFEYGTHGRSVLDGASSPSVNPPPQQSDGLAKVTGLGHLEFSGGDVLWFWNQEPSSAQGVQYEVTVDGQYVGTVSETQWISRNLWIGDHSLTVKAVNPGNTSERSDNYKIWINRDGSGSINGYTGSVSPPPPEPLPPPRQQESEDPQPVQNTVGDPNAANVQSLIDPASYAYSEVSNKEGYELVFSDEFNGTSLNPYRWHSQFRWDGEFNGERLEYRVINGEKQFYVNVLSDNPKHRQQAVPLHNPFKFDGQRLGIQAIINPVKNKNTNLAWGGLEDILYQQQFLSGAISSYGKFYQKYGYFEARIKIPAHEGAFPAFWLNHERKMGENTRRTEIDIMENLGHKPEYVYNSFHYYNNVSATYDGDHASIKPKPQGQIYSGVDYSKDYHVYAVKWEPGRVIYLIDGVETSRVESGEANNEEKHILLNLAMGAKWINDPVNSGGMGRPWPNADDLAKFGSPMLEIDYIRAYKPK